MLVRPMMPEDAKAVSLIESEAFSQPWSEQGFLDALNMNENIILVAEENGSILGYECTYVSFGEGELTNIAVKKTCRKRGIGTSLMKELQKRAVQNGVNTIVLEARVSNKTAIAMYEKMGFLKLGIRKNLYEYPVEDAVIMSCTVEENKC